MVFFYLYNIYMSKLENNKIIEESKIESKDEKERTSNLRSNLIRFRNHYNKEEIKIRYEIMFFVSALAGVAISLAGSIAQLYGVKIQFHFLFFTNITNMAIMFYYGAKVIFYFSNKAHYEKMKNLNLHGFSTTLMLQIMMLIIFVLGPLSLMYNVFGVGPGAVRPDMSFKGSFVGSTFSNIFIHGATPIFAILDYAFTRHDKKEVEKIKYTGTIWWTTLFLVYSIFVLIMSSDNLLGVFPYTILDPRSYVPGDLISYPTYEFFGWGYYVLIWYGFVIGIFYGNKMACLKYKKVFG